MTRLGIKDRGWTLLLIVGGVLLLGVQLGWLSGLSDWLWSLLFTAAGVVFVITFLNDAAKWWALIPASALIGIGLVFVTDERGGAYFLGMLGLGFAAVYLTGRQRWWAVIPGGTLLTLAIVAWIDLVAPRMDSAWVFFLGIAATFGFLYLLPRDQGGQGWAIYPAAGAATVMAIILLTQAVTGVLLPVLLIIVGGYLLWRGGGLGPRQPRLPERGI